MPDTRPLDDWGNPIGNSYEKKKWEELTPDEMKADFEWKSDILDALGEEVSCATFYQDYLFKDLYEGRFKEEYKVLVTEYDAEAGSKVHKVDVDEIEDYLDLNDVALSPCLFHGNWRKKKLINYVPAFVLDIDKLRPNHLQRFFRLFDEGRLLRPTFIANSGSGVHFYYILDQMLRCDSGYNEANNLIAEAIYRALYDDVIKKEKWKDAQRHWIGQDYRVVNSKTKLDQVSKIFKTGDVYTIDQLAKHYDIQIDTKKRYASKSMIKYATSIAKDLEIETPDFSNSKETYDFIQKYKDSAYVVREERRQKRAAKNKNRSKRKEGSWYQNTLHHMQDHTQAGYRFSSMKALAIIAYKERSKITRDMFLQDLEDLTKYWSSSDWDGDDFNSNNVKDIIRLYDNAEKYSNTTAETLEEWLGYPFKRVGTKRNGLKQKDHLEIARAIQVIKDKQQGKNWREGNGRPVGSGTAEEKVKVWRKKHPKGLKIDCHRDTGLSRVTINKWWKDTDNHLE